MGKDVYEGSSGNFIVYFYKNDINADRAVAGNDRSGKAEGL